MNVHKLDPRILIVDDVVPDPVRYRQTALAQAFDTVSFSEEERFHGIAVDEHHTVPRFLAETWGLDPRLSFFRRSPQGQVEPHFIHHDAGMGEWTAILYLNEHPPLGDGTTFWTHRGMVRPEWDDLAQWVPTMTVPARFNRLLVFASSLFHSRALFANYGEGDDARLIQVVFGIGPFPRECQTWR